ncbi:MAG: hypothetical protein ACI30D_03120 [Muribaculaceae bacterium]
MKSLLFAAVAGVALLSACSSSNKEAVDVPVENNSEMGVIDNGDSLVVDDVDLADSAQIAQDTTAQAAPAQAK